MFQNILGMFNIFAKICKRFKIHLKYFVKTAITFDVYVKLENIGICSGKIFTWKRLGQGNCLDSQSCRNKYKTKILLQTFIWSRNIFL